ncbi:MAG: phosphate ABC transporter substrate-binding protein [Bacteroidia bacterium]|nr:phosphate ABC transporter substrate-binding protein [Bacteroidia bacterium]MDW8347240.1 phosphate ABC transporter substrate-binding protein [Bacteroidia bacterium]
MKTALLWAIFCASIGLSQTTIEISGSQFMKPIVEKLIEKYQQKNKNVNFSLNMKGSDMGLKALTANITDICASTKVMNPKELERFKADNYGQPPVMLPIGKNAIAILVNKSNKIKEISFEQLAGIYTGKINNWKELGLADVPIKVLSYPNSSGVYPFFRTKVLNGEDYREDLIIVPNTPEMLDSIKANPGAIGYADIFHAEKVDAINFQKYIRLVAVRSTEQYVALLPEEVHILSNQYPIVTTMYFITRKPPEGEVKKFMDWVISPEGQSVLKKHGYYPLY